jgi:hypothetical protein
MLDVIGDVLDKPVLDRDGRPLGRVDGITVTLVEGQPPRLDSALVGPVALAGRVSPSAERLVSAVRRMLRLPGEGTLALPFTHLEIKHQQLDADVSAAATGLLALEQRLQRWLAKIPGSR